MVMKIFSVKAADISRFIDDNERSNIRYRKAEDASTQQLSTTSGTPAGLSKLPATSAGLPTVSSGKLRAVLKRQYRQTIRFRLRRLDYSMSGLTS